MIFVSVMRLDKYIATYTDMSRKEAKAAIKKGRIRIEDEIVKKEDYKVSEHQKVVLDGERIQAESFVYYMLNKPAGVVSATKDNYDTTVVELLKIPGRQLFPMGRLDKDTEGLLIMTDDGMLAHRLLSPKYHVEKTYEIIYEGVLDEDATQQMEKGLDIGEKKLTLPAKLELLGDKKARLTIAEGKFHQVKRMIAKVGGTVTYLKRVSMAGLELDECLQPGEYRKLTKEEVERLRGEEG